VKYAANRFLLCQQLKNLPESQGLAG